MNEFDSSEERSSSGPLVLLLLLLVLSGAVPDAALEYLDGKVSEELGRRLADQVEAELKSGAWRLTDDDLS